MPYDEVRQIVRRGCNFGVFLARSSCETDAAKAGAKPLPRAKAQHPVSPASGGTAKKALCFAKVFGRVYLAPAQIADFDRLRTE